MYASNRLRILGSVTCAAAAAVLVAGCASMPGSMRAGLAMVADRSDFKDSSVFEGSQDRGNVGWKVFGEFDLVVGRNQRNVRPDFILIVPRTRTS